MATEMMDAKKQSLATEASSCSSSLPPCTVEDHFRSLIKSFIEDKCEVVMLRDIYIMLESERGAFDDGSRELAKSLSMEIVAQTMEENKKSANRLQRDKRRKDRIRKSDDKV